jgi:hypothetical protein
MSAEKQANKERIDSIAASLLEDIGVPRAEAKAQIRNAPRVPLREPASQPEVGRPIAIVIFWQESHCIQCGASYSGPRYGQSAFLKRWFPRARFFSHEPLPNVAGSMYETLPRRVDTAQLSLHNCPACINHGEGNGGQGSFQFPEPETKQ